MNLNHLLLLGATTSEESGRMAGQAFFLVITLAGALKCWGISQRPATNRKAALSLMLALIGMVVASLLGMVLKMTAGSSLIPLISAVSSILMLALFIGGLILAILGLKEISDQPDVFTQGRRQAIGAMVLMGIILVTGLSGFIAAAKRTASAGNRPAGGVLRDEDLNFVFRDPGKPWVPFNTTNLVKESKAGFMRRFPEMYFMIIPEKLGSDFSSQDLAELGKAQLQAAAQSVRVLKQEPREINGLNGIVMETEARVRSQDFFYERWYCVTNGFGYQLVSYGRLADREKVIRESRAMFTNFTVIDPHRLASFGRTFPTNFRSGLYGYSVEVTNSSWHTFESLAEDLPEAEFGASQGDSCFAVVPVWLGGETLEPEALAAGLLSTFNVEYPDESLTQRKELRDGKAQGLQFDYSRTIEKRRFSYRFQLLQTDGIGYLVGAWTQRSSSAFEAIMADAIKRVRIEGISSKLLSRNTPFSARERKTQGEVLNQAGLYHFNGGEYEKALALFRAASSADAQETYIINGLLSWRYLDRPSEALTFLEKQPATVLSSPKVRAHQAFFQAQASMTDTALTNYAELFKGGYRNEKHLTEYINLLDEQERYDQALAVLASYLKTEDTVAVRLLEAEVYRLKKELPKAIAILKAQHDRAPFDAGVAQDLAAAQMDAGQHSDALETARQLVRSHKDSAYAHYYKGRAELGLKWYREAKASFETAVKLLPADKHIRSYLDHVSGLLGEGGNSSIKDPIAPVPLPAFLTNTVSANIPEGFGKAFGAYQLRHVAAISFQRGKEYKLTEYMLVKILDASGVTTFSSMQRSFDPLSEDIYLNEVRVMDAAGKTISTGSISNCYVLDEFSGHMVSQAKVLNVPIPGLRPGCQLAITITRRETGVKEFPLLDHFFSRRFPVWESVVFLAGNGEGLAFRASPDVKEAILPEGRYWRIQNPTVARWEPNQPPACSFLPMLWGNEAAAKWPVLVSNYVASLGDRMEADPQVSQQARKWVAGVDKLENKISILARQVQSNLTYKAIEFGRRARVPNPAGTILHNRYGDCKDHALLLRQMLRAVDVPAELALVSQKSLIQKDLPSLDQFDHMIVYLPSRGRFIDCTAKGTDPADALPLGQAGREALILDGKDPRFVSIPKYDSTASTISTHKQLRIIDHADADVEETLTLTGVHASYMRYFLLDQAPESRKTTLQRQMEMADVELTQFKIEGLETPEKPLRLHCSYTLKKQFHRVNDQLTGYLRPGLEKTYLTTQPVDIRLTPFELTLPFRLHSSVSILIPPGYRCPPLAGTDPKLDSRFIAAREKIENRDGTLEVSCDLDHQSGSFKAGDYSVYRQTMAQALSLLEREISFKVNAAAGSRAETK